MVLQQLIFAPNDRPEIELDLKGDLSELKKKVFTIKEGTQYKLKVQFRVQRQIVSGLRYVQSTYRKGIRGVHSHTHTHTLTHTHTHTHTHTRVLLPVLYMTLCLKYHVHTISLSVELLDLGRIACLDRISCTYLYTHVT